MPRRPASTPEGRRLLVLGLLGTVLVLLADLAGAGATAVVRERAIAVFGPLERVLSGADRAKVATLEREVVRLRAELDAAHDGLVASEQLGRLLASDAARGQVVVAARVVGAQQHPDGALALTIDVGRDDGVQPDAMVVGAAGLVGRVTASSGRTSDIALAGAPGSPVAVRVGDAGRLGWVQASTTADPRPRPAGQLSLTLAGPGTVQVGERVTTMGSSNGRPYAPGVLVGTVTAVDPVVPGGAMTGAVRRAVAVDELDVVAVVAGPERTALRPTSTTGPGQGLR